MSRFEILSSPALPSTGRFLPILLILFVGSGAAALIYEIVWFQMLQLLIGSSAVSLGVLLGTFMGGLCLGSLSLPRLVSPRRHPLRVYALLELGIGLVGIVLLYGMPFIERFYQVVGGHGSADLLLRGAVCAACLLPPTLMMGATLPAAARWFETSPRGISWIGFFYGANTVGAVGGCLLAVFYLLRIHDIEIATWTAAAVNGALALIALSLASRAPHRAHHETLTNPSPEIKTGSWVVYVVIGLSGMSAMGAEVVWTRLLSLLLGGTVYTFAIILAMFLAGLGFGSHVGSLVARSAARPKIVLGWCQISLAAAVAWTAVTVSDFLPYWPIDSYLPASSSVIFELDILRCLWAVLPATVLWGASFPLALAAASSRRQEPGKLVGGIYAANTLGAIVGALGFSLIAIPFAGTQDSQRLLIGMSFTAGILLLAPPLLRFRPADRPPGPIKARMKIWSLVSLAAAAGGAVFLISSVGEVPWELVAYGRRLPAKLGTSIPHYVGEGMNSSVAVSETTEGWLNFHVSGKVVASSDPWDMRIQNMLGHVPAMIHPDPRSVLIVGCGAGVTAGTFVLYPGVERIVICEIEPLIPEAAALYFRRENHHVMDDPRVEIVIDDARHFILTTRESFDIITSDPIHPWLKGSAALYSKEYFELCRKRLNPGGLVTQWVPLYESTPEVVKSEMATFFEVFPEGTVWSNDLGGIGYDVLLLARFGKLRIDADGLEKRFQSTGHLPAVEALRSVGLGTTVDFLALYAGRGPDLEPWFRGAEINRDRNMRLQYLAGMGINTQEGARIFDSILDYCRYPEDLLTATAPFREALEKILGARK